jgi:hypothetical protein
VPLLVVAVTDAFLALRHLPAQQFPSEHLTVPPVLTTTQLPQLLRVVDPLLHLRTFLRHPPYLPLKSEGLCLHEGGGLLVTTVLSNECLQFFLQAFDELAELYVFGMTLVAIIHEAVKLVFVQLFLELHPCLDR